MEVAPREFVLTLQNYQKAYASEYTYSTFVNSLIFASGSAGLTFLLGDGSGLADGEDEYTATQFFRAHRGRSADPAGRAGIDRLDLPPKPKVRLCQRCADASLWIAVAAIQRFFAPGNDLGSLGWAGAARVPDDGGGVQVDGPFTGRVGDDVRGEYVADIAPRDLALAHADDRFRAFDSCLCAPWNRSRPRRSSASRRAFTSTRVRSFSRSMNIRLTMGAGPLWRWDFFC